MKRITVSVDEETHRLAKLKAAERGTSVSGLVREYLVRLTKESSEAGEPESKGSEKSDKTLSEVIADIFARGGGLDPRDNLTREELHDRSAFR